MQKLADTLRGTVLIEMTQEEWEYLQLHPKAPTADITWASLEEWRNQFVTGLDRLGLSPRPYNAIIRYCTINESGIQPQLLRDRPFKDGRGNLMSFEAWCEFCLHDDPAIAQLGRNALTELRQAIKRFRQNYTHELEQAVQSQEVVTKLLFELYPEGPVKENLKAETVRIKQRLADG